MARRLSHSRPLALCVLLLQCATAGERCAAALVTVADDTYYRELGVPTDASPTEITKAYRKLALRWHPDKNADDKVSAEAKFVRLANAYEILSNAALRRVYDLNGLGRSRASAGAGGTSTSGGAEPPGSGLKTFRFRSAEEIFNDVFGQDGDLFADFFADDASAGGTAPDGSVAVESNHLHRGHTEVTKTRTITRTSTVDGQQRSISRTHSTTNRDGVTVTKRAGERMTTDGRQVKTAEIEERRADGHRRYERRQMVDGELKHYDARLDPDREILHPDL